MYSLCDLITLLESSNIVVYVFPVGWLLLLIGKKWKQEFIYSFLRLINVNIINREGSFLLAPIAITFCLSLLICSSVAVTWMYRRQIGFSGEVRCHTHTVRSLDAVNTV